MANDPHDPHDQPTASDTDTDDPEVEGHALGLEPKLGFHNPILDNYTPPEHRGDTDGIGLDR